MRVIVISVSEASIYNDPMKPPKTAKTILKFERARVGIVVDSCKRYCLVGVPAVSTIPRELLPFLFDPATRACYLNARRFKMGKNNRIETITRPV